MQIAHGWTHHGGISLTGPRDQPPALVLPIHFYWGYYFVCLGFMGFLLLAFLPLFCNPSFTRTMNESSTDESLSSFSFFSKHLPGYSTKVALYK